MLSCLFFTLACATMSAGCSREPLDDCPSISFGSLVFSEISENWIEITNMTGTTYSVSGLRVRMMKLDGSSATDFIVRGSALFIEPNERIVLGNYSQYDLTRPSYIMYGWSDEFRDDEGELAGKKLHSAGVLELYACDVLVDQMAYLEDPPATGSWTFDGGLSLDYLSNDDVEAWCKDTTGTPGEANSPCH